MSILNKKGRLSLKKQKMSVNKIKIATLNFCLGLRNKKLTILGPMSVELFFRTYYMTPMLQISDFGRSDQKYNHRPDNCILILRKCRPED